MLDMGGLGRPGGARSVYVESPILDGQRPALRLAERFARVPLDVAIDARKFVVAGAMSPDLCRTRKVRQRGGQCIDELHGHDDVLGRDEVDAMRERGTGEIRIEQRRDTADPG